MTGNISMDLATIPVLLHKPLPKGGVLISHLISPSAEKAKIGRKGTNSKTAIPARTSEYAYSCKIGLK